MSNSTDSPLSISSANLLYLATIMLSLTLGAMMQTRHFTWGLIASEVLLFLLPTIVLLRQRGIPLIEGLRLKPIRPLIGLLCVLLGFTTFLFIFIIDAIMVQLTRMLVSSVPADMMPKGEETKTASLEL